MPPALCVYGLTRKRDFDTLQRFLDEYVDRMASEDRGDEELMLIPLGASDPDPAWSTDKFDWEPAVTLTRSLQRGLDYPRRGFALYLKSKHAEFDAITLGFTSDDQLVLGLDIDDEGMQPENEERARSVLMALGHKYGCYLGLITVERGPPLSEESFQLESRNPLTVVWTMF